MNMAMRAVVWVAIASGCGDELAQDADPSEPLFETDRLLEIDIELAAADWDALRVEHHDLFDRLLEGCPGPLPAGPYTVFPATMTIDGERFENVGVRKKGFLGSINR